LNIGKEIMDKGKSRRLEQLKQRYFDLYMDKISLEAIGDTGGAVQRAQQMEALGKSYTEIAKIDTSRGVINK